MTVNDVLRIMDTKSASVVRQSLDRMVLMGVLSRAKDMDAAYHSHHYRAAKLPKTKTALREVNFNDVTARTSPEMTAKDALAQLGLHSGWTTKTHIQIDNKPVVTRGTVFGVLKDGTVATSGKVTMTPYMLENMVKAGWMSAVKA